MLDRIIIETIKDKRGTGKNGLYLPVLTNEIDARPKEIKKALNQMHEEGKIQIRRGLNGKLIYLKDE